MKMHNKATKKLSSKQLMLNAIREKQNKEGGGYITTKSLSYKIFRWSFLVALLACTAINLFYILGTSLQLSAHLTHGGELQPHQLPQVNALKQALILMGISSLTLLLSEAWIWFKKPLLQLVFCLGSSVAIIAIMSGQISDPTSSTLSNHHVIPLCILCALCLIASVLHMHQLRRDKICCNALAEIIYNKFSLTADSLSEEQLREALAEFDPVFTPKEWLATQRAEKKKQKEKNKAAKTKDIDEQNNEADEA